MNKINKTNINSIVANVFKKHWIKSVVVKGRGQGKTLGFPTLNLKLKTSQHLVLGVYICKIKVKNRIYKGLLHYGPRPTFGRSKPGLEIHVLDFDKEIKPGKKIQFKLLKYLRKIRKFKTKEDLIKQIRKDIEISENS